ncbi:MAG TPA: S41 family peptidase [Patescibacteria group bacterium]|nr:S41 family peptidase [Patescibacteria group bacterium]
MLKSKKRLLVLLTILVTVVAVSLYVWAEDKKKENPLAELERFNEVLVKIKDYYVEEKSYSELMDAAIQGMLKELDPHSIYLSKHQYENLLIDTKGEFGGLGIQIAVRDNYPTVISPIEDTPAYRLGIQAGDRIIEIEGESTKGWITEQAVSKLRGRPGTQVNVTIGREGTEDSLHYTITREIIQVPSITYSDVIGDVGYVRIARFSESTASELNEILNDFDKRVMDGLVLDLRWNPGGLLTAACEVADLFLDEKKLIVYTESRIPEHQQKFYSSQNNFHSGYPIVVLANGASASASEIVAGALQDLDRAAIVGQTTFGKGSVQTVFRIGDSAALKLTTQKYFTPSGRSIHRDEVAETPEEPEIADKELKEEYHTANGRIVYGGGGITPDWELALPEYTDVQRRLDRRGIFFSFAVHYTAYNDAGENFTVDDSVMKEFRSFIASNEIEVKDEEWNEHNTQYVKEGIKREVFRKLMGSKGAYIATIPVDEELNMVLDLFRQTETLEEMFNYIQQKNELAKTEEK